LWKLAPSLDAGFSARRNVNRRSMTPFKTRMTVTMTRWTFCYDKVSCQQESIEKAIRIMNELNMDPQSSTISFAQLLGMSDNLTYNLGQNGFRAYKYVPYGQVAEVMPYLVRRA
jgi:Proline dehydrogenase